MRRWIVAATSALALLAGLLTTVPAASGAPPAAAGSARVTLITGDVVTLTPAAAGRYAATVQPGPGRERMRFHTFELDGGVRVLPEDAISQVTSGVLDADLFDVQELVEQGYGGSDTLPLIVQYADGNRGPTTMAASGAIRPLPSIGGAAVSARTGELPQLWQTLKHGAAQAFSGGIKKVWLDGKVKPVLDRSVPQIGAPAAWQAGYDGTGVEVAVLDTGADQGHPDLAGKVDQAQNFTDSADTVDHFGHGTHVAATVAGSGAGSGGLRKGVAPGARLLVGKVLNDEGTGYDSWIIAGMEWATAAGAKVVSMSLGGDPTDGTDPLSQAVNRISADTGALFVIAAGNEGSEQSVGTPGAADAALTVGAVDRSDQLADFSSRGPRIGDHAIKPDLTAPGVDIVAARAAGTSMGTPVDTLYTAASGTSMATPHVAGAAALLAQANPGLTGQQLKDLLVSTTTPTTGETPFGQGSGRADVARAVQQKVVASGNLSFGVQELPDAQPSSRPVTYTNRGSTPVTLDLALQVTNLGNGQPSTAGFSIGSTRITVPAGGTAEVPVTLTPTALPRGQHAGWLVATSNGVSVRTSVASTVRGRHHQVTLKMRNRAGQLDSSPLVALFGDSREAVAMGWIPPWAKETGVTLEVEEGNYLLHSLGSDGQPQDEQVTLFTDPNIDVTKDMTIELDMRKATPIRIETPKPSEQQTVQSYYVQRTHANGRRILAGVMDFSVIKQVNVTPTRKPPAGYYEFSSRWQLVAPMVQAVVPGMGGPLDAHLLGNSPAYDGKKRFRMVTAGTGKPDELAAANVRGKMAVLAPSTEVSEDDQVRAAAEAGAVAVLIQRPVDWVAWTVWRPVGDRLPVPALVLSYPDGQRLLPRAAGKTIDVTLTTSSPYLYDVFHLERDRVPDKIVHKVTRSNTTQLTVRYANTGGFGWSKEQRYGWRPWQEYSWNDTQRMVRTPSVRDEWVSANDSLWQQHVAYFYTWDDMNPVYGSTQPPRSYKPGRGGTESWFTPVVRPAAPGTAGAPVSVRSNDQLQFRVPEFTDASGHYQRRFEGEAVSAQVFRNGTLVQELPDAWQNVDTVAGDAAYKLVLQTAKSNEDWQYATSTTTAWEFRSRRGAAVLPMLQVDYRVPASLDGQVSGRWPHLIGLSVRRQPGLAAPLGTTIRAEVSFDEGGSWRSVPVLGFGNSVLALVPSGKGTVSLRVKAKDADGNAVTQTVVRAYGLS